MKNRHLTTAAGIAVCIAANPAFAQDQGLEAEFEAYVGQDVVPPDVIESEVGQDRIESLIGANAAIAYNTGPALIEFSGWSKVYPTDSRYNRFGIGPSIGIDIPLTEQRRTRLRVGASYEYVFDDEDRVFDRVRGDVQLIHRHSRENTTILRARYGYRNQSEERFTGFDQDEFLGELRHIWRPNGGPASINLSLLGLHHKADDDRFSYDGYGLMVIGRAPLDENWRAFARLSVVQRDYEDLFSQVYPVRRDDRHMRAMIGAERGFDQNLSFFFEVGYVDNSSNVPVRDFDGLSGQIGIRWRTGQ